MDPRLCLAVDASLGWYEDLCAVHGVRTAVADGIWFALDPPPPLHSDAVALEPAITADQVLERLDGRAHCGVKDSFARMDLSGGGMSLLFAATWIYHEGGRRDRSVTPPGWSTVTTADELAEWTGHHDTGDVLVPSVLRREHFRILAKRVEGRIAAGAVARLGRDDVVDVSNVYVVPGHSLDWAELVDVVGSRFPGRALVGYERGPAFDAALDGGFVPVGDLRVWSR
jgi:hypothetical protein